MSRKHSFEITLSNNTTEKEGFTFLLSKNNGFFEADKKSKLEILEILQLDRRYSRSFDLVYIPQLNTPHLSSNIIRTYFDDIILVELKTTKKFLPDNPKGFFFGATEKEFDFAKKIGNKFRFCLVCLNEKSPSFVLLTLQELEEKIKIKRIQYQINL